MGYTRRAIWSVSWVGALRVSNRAITYVKLAILARLLSPEQFGVFGIASLVLAFLEIITATGINVFLIQEKVEVKEYINSAWVVSILRGVLISASLILISPVIVRFFNTPGAFPLLLLIAVVPFIRGFINPAIVSFQKELLFSKEFIFRFVIYFADTVAAILFAIKTHSAISFILGMIVGVVIETALSHILIKPRPKLKVNIDQVRKVVNRGKWVTLAGFFEYLFENVDDGTVGKILDSASLGYYQMAYKISSLPITEISEIIGRVTFPIYTNISGDVSRLKKAYIKSVVAISLLTIPIGLVLLFFPEPLVRFILGANWLPIVPVVRVMSFFGVAKAITSSSYSLFLAIKKQEYVMMTTLVGILGLGATIIPFVKMWGIVGAGISTLVGVGVTIPVTLILLAKVFR